MFEHAGHPGHPHHPVLQCPHGQMLTLGSGTCKQCGQATFGPEFELCPACARSLKECPVCRNPYVPNLPQKREPVHEYIVLHAADTGVHFHVQRGIPLRVELPQDTGSGLHWIVGTIHDRNVLGPLAPENPPQRNGRKTKVFDVSTVGAGATTLQFFLVGASTSSSYRVPVDEQNQTVTFFIEVFEPNTSTSEGKTAPDAGGAA